VGIKAIQRRTSQREWRPSRGPPAEYAIWPLRSLDMRLCLRSERARKLAAADVNELAAGFASLLS